MALLRHSGTKETLKNILEDSMGGKGEREGERGGRMPQSFHQNLLARQCRLSPSKGGGMLKIRLAWRGHVSASASSDAVLLPASPNRVLHAPRFSFSLFLPIHGFRNRVMPSPLDAIFQICRKNKRKGRNIQRARKRQGEGTKRETNRGRERERQRGGLTRDRQGER